MHIEVFGIKNQWYWHFVNRGEVKTDSPEFPSRSHAIVNAKGVVRGICRRLSWHALPAWLPVRFDKKKKVYILDWC